MPLAWVAAGGIPKIGAGSRWMGSKLHRGEGEEKGEEENSILRAQPAPGAKSLRGVWEQGVWSTSPNFPLCLSLLVL